MQQVTTARPPVKSGPPLFDFFRRRVKRTGHEHMGGGEIDITADTDDDRPALGAEPWIKLLR
jgi:hypothetical protein